MGLVIQGSPFGPTPTPIVAAFTSDVTTGVAPLTVQFTDLSTGSPTSWAWSFGDGGTSTDQNPTHLFEYYGTYLITLLASNASYSDTAVGYVYMSAGPRLAQIDGTLILDGNFTINSDFIISYGGVVIPIADTDISKTFYQYNTNSYKTANGKSRTITSNTGDVIIEGLICGKGRGFESNRGPGNNTLLTDSSGNTYNGYGATHAGLGYIDTTAIAPSPSVPYGDWETPVSLGSGGGYYHPPQDLIGTQTRGGGGIKLVARSGNVRVNGYINVNGEDGTYAGGAAGGSAWLVGWFLDGTGTIHAQGGQTLLADNAGGGGGGYISLWYDRANNFDGTMSVAGNSGGGDGKIFTKQIEPILEDRFTGSIWNTKWWDHTGNITIDNDLTLNSPALDYFIPAATSKFTISGKEIMINLDYIPDSSEIPQYTAEFMLYVDDLNWVGVARRKTGIFGISSVDGIVSASGVPFDNTDVGLRLLKNDSTFTFQYYDATSTPQTIYRDVRPELANEKFKIRMLLDKPGPGDIRSEYLRLSPLDITNQYLQLNGTPVDQSAVALNMLTGTSQYYGVDFYADENKVKWDGLVLSDFLETGDRVRILYEWGDYTSADGIEAVFDNLRVFEGVVKNHETTEPVIYVDPDYGSDTSSGRQLEPIKNLFVATAWSKDGGTVVLYDGTHNPTSVARKDITLRGAEGTKPLITTEFVKDTTGSGWEDTALSLYGCQGLVENVTISNAVNGIIVENGEFDIIRNTIIDTTNPILFINCDPTVARNRIGNCRYAIDFTASHYPNIFSNVIFDASVAIRLVDTPDATISSNTFDNNQTHIVLDSSSPAVISNNNLTYAVLAIQASTDSSVGVFNNNFFETETWWNRTPEGDQSNIDMNPLYYDRFNRDYHINPGSPNKDAGVLTYDSYRIDHDGATRVPFEV